MVEQLITSRDTEIVAVLRAMASGRGVQQNQITLLAVLLVSRNRVINKWLKQASPRRGRLNGVC